jgi:hypothetical protein
LVFWLNVVVAADAGPVRAPTTPTARVRASDGAIQRRREREVVRGR